MPSLTPIPVGTLILTPAAHGSSVSSITAEHVIVHPDATNAIETTTDSDYSVSPGQHYTFEAGDTVFTVDRYGTLYCGLDALFAPWPRQNEQQTVADFLYDPVMQRFMTRSISMAQIDDPADITGIRFGPTGGYPYALLNNEVGTHLDLCGLETNTAVAQFRSKAGAIPYNGDLTTIGSLAEATQGTVSFKTAERPRYLKSGNGTLDLACGCLVEFQLTPNGYNGRQDSKAMRMYGNGNVQIGRSAVSSGDNGAHLQIRGDSGTSEIMSLARSGAVTSGTFTLTWFGAPPSSPAYATSAAVTAAIAASATAGDVASALETAIGTAVSNLTGTLAVATSTSAVSGTGTAFTTELRVNDYITIAGVDYKVNSITSDTLLFTTVAYAAGSASGLTVVRRNIAGTGGPLPNSAVTLNFCGALRHAHYVRPTVNSSLVGGGTFVVDYSTYGFASGLTQIMLDMLGGGQVNSVRTVDYLRVRNNSGTTLLSLDSVGCLNLINTVTSTQTIATSATLVDKSAQVVLADTSSVAITATLPASPTEGSKFIFIDKGSSWGTRNLTIARNGKNIDGVAANKTMSTSNTNATLLYAGGGWWTL